MRCTKISPEFERRRQRSKVKVTGTKKTRTCGFCSGVVLWGTVLRQFYAGGKISACCLVWNCRCFVKHSFRWFDNVRWLSDTKGSRYARKPILPVPLHSLFGNQLRPTCDSIKKGRLNKSSVCVVPFAKLNAVVLSSFRAQDHRSAITVVRGLGDEK